MIILGLGSNLNDRLENLRQALVELRKLPGMVIHQVSPVYISDALLPDNAPENWNLSYLNIAVRCDVKMDPQDLIVKVKEIERAIGRDEYEKSWAPRVIDIDILAWDDQIIDTKLLTLPHKHVHERPFALWPLADVAPMWRYPGAGPLQGKTAAELVEAWGSRYELKAPYRTHQIAQRVDTPRLMGIINITPDSFSDGDHFLDADKAMQQAMRLVLHGAEILDIGAESTAPNARPLSNQEEWARLEPVLSAIKAIKRTLVITPKISLDTRHARVLEKALAYDIDIINDVSGLDDLAMRQVVQKSGKDCVIMHHLSLPEDRKNVLSRQEDVVKTVFDWGKQRLQELEKQGLQLDKIIFDPGIGFGKCAEQSLLLLQNVSQFTQLGTRILVGHSRKSFMTNFTIAIAAERDIETAVISTYLAQQPVDYLRVHNVEMTARSFRVAKLLQG